MRDVSFAPHPAAPVQLRGRLRLPPSGTPARGAVVLCHPHPAYGGNMDVWLLPALASALAEDGWAVLRFDFRSVELGMRPGGQDAHQDEIADTAGAVRFLRAEGLLAPGSRLVVGGWSFGALITLLYGLGDEAVTDWFGIAPPTRALDELPMRPVPTEQVRAWPARRIAIVGAHDQFFPPEHADAVAPHQLEVLDHCDHFFFDRDRELSLLVRDALRQEPKAAS